MRTERLCACSLFVIRYAPLTCIAVPEVQTIVPIAISVLLRQIRDVLLAEVTRDISSIDVLLPLIPCLSQSMLCCLYPAVKECIYCDCLKCKATLRSNKQFFIRLFSQ